MKIWTLGGLWLLAHLLVGGIHADSGFLKFDDAALPERVKKATESTFLWLILPERPSYDLHVDFYQKTLAAFKDKNLFHPGYLKWLSGKLKKCQDQKKDVCPYYETFLGTGSAFLAGSSDRLWTAFHVVDESVNALLSAEQNRTERGAKYFALLKSGVSLNMALIDRSGEVVFDTTNGDRAELAVFVDLPSFYPPAELAIPLMASSADFAEVRLNRALPAPALTFADRKPAVGEKVFATGFPEKTEGRRAEPNVHDSDGSKLWVSRGKIIDAGAYVEAVGIKNLSDNGKKVIGKLNTYSDIDVSHGNSGGPWVNEDGKVVGISALGPGKTAFRGAAVSPQIEHVMDLRESILEASK